jgi:hypothetical protein
VYSPPINTAASIDPPGILQKPKVDAYRQVTDPYNTDTYNKEVGATMSRWYADERRLPA